MLDFRRILAINDFQGAKELSMDLNFTLAGACVIIAISVLQLYRRDDDYKVEDVFITAIGLSMIVADYYHLFS